MIILTGAAGLIGSAVARELNRRGRDDLVLVDHLGESDKWMNLRSLAYLDYFEKDEFLGIARDGRLPGDLGNLSIDAIIHLGANSATTERDATHLVENNYRYSIALAELAAGRRIRFVYASSAATYGDGDEGFDDDPAKMQDLRPLNMYGYSKQMFDLWLRRRNFQPHCAGLKYFNVYGPNEYHKGEMRSLVHKAFGQIVETGKLKLFKSHRSDYEDGKQMRDFLYVEDAAKMTVHFAIDNTTAAGVFNCGSGQANTWLTLADAIFKAMGRETNVDFIDMPDHLRDRYRSYTCAPIDRLRGTGYIEAITPLADAVGDYVKNYLLQDERRA